MNYSRNTRFNHQSEQASESALVSRNTDETEKRLGGAGEPPIILTSSKEESLSAAMWELYKSLLPTKESDVNRKMFAEKIEKILNDEWPGKEIKVHMFGSSMNELGTTQSDVDLCVTHTTQWNGLKNIFHLSSCLERHGMKIEQIVHKAKVPIVRLSDPNLDLACDINVNNTLALHNTRLIRNYVRIDPRVRPLAMVVKHWARRRVLNDAAKGGTISTYTWTCIILNFLQMRKPPILPVLHNLPHDDVEPILVNGEDASFFENVETLSEFGSDNKESLGGLLFEFFKRMAFEFDYDNHVISLRQGKYLTKAEKGWDTCKGWKMLCVEEPFNTARNLGNSADDISVNGLRDEFRRAYNILYDSASLDKLCEEYHFPSPYNNYYYQNRNYNNNNNKRGNYKRNFNKTNSTWNGGKSCNRKSCTKYYQQNGQNNLVNHMTDNFHDMNGKNNYSQDPQDNEEDGSSMRRFDNGSSLRQNGHYITMNGNEEFPVSSEFTHDYHMRYHENNDCTRKQFDKRQIHKEDEQQIRNKNNLNNIYYMKKKNDGQFNNYGRNSQSSDFDSSIYEGVTRYADTPSNQNKFVYKNNNQKADNNPCQKNARSYSTSRFQNSPCSDQKSCYIQNTNIPYEIYHSNTLSDFDQKPYVAYNQGAPNYKHKQARQVEDSSSSSVISPSHSKPIIDYSSSNPNFDRSNPVQMKFSHKPNNNNKNRNNNKLRQFQKHTENVNIANNAYSYNYKASDSSIPPNSISPIMVSTQSDSIYSANHGSGLLPQQQLFQNYHRQSNDGSANYQRRMSHQSSSDGSNSQTSGNTSNTSYSNSSNYTTKNNFQKNNSNQNNYQQQNQNKSNNSNNGFNKKRKHYNTNNNSNSGNGNSRLNNTTSNLSPAITSNYNGYELISNTPSHMNQGQYSSSKVNDYNGNNDTNGYKTHNGSNGYSNNFKGFNNNSNNSNIWKNSNGHNTTSSKINGISSTNYPKSANGCNNSSNRSTNGSNLSNSSNNYSRSNVNNNNHHYRNQTNNNNNVNSHKSVNGNNYKSIDGGNNSSNVQTKNFNYSNQMKNGGNSNNKKIYRNKARRAENKEDGVNYQQQYSQEALLQEQHNIQSQQQKKMVQNGQNNNGGKGKGGCKKLSNLKQNIECQQQQ